MTGAASEAPGEGMLALGRLLRYRFAYRRVISPEARVDPAQFPEDEFPVECMRCGYELRGLPEERCPECGTAFDRGRLLVEQYVLWRRPRTDQRCRVAKLCGRAGVLLLTLNLAMWAAVFIPISCNWVSMEALAEGVDFDTVFGGVLVFLGVQFLAVLLLGANAFLWWISSPRYGAKRRQVAKAIGNKGGQAE